MQSKFNSLHLHFHFHRQSIVHNIITINRLLKAKRAMSKLPTFPLAMKKPITPAQLCPRVVTLLAKPTVSGVRPGAPQGEGTALAQGVPHSRAVPSHPFDSDAAVSSDTTRAESGASSCKTPLGNPQPVHVTIPASTAAPKMGQAAPSALAGATARFWPPRMPSWWAVFACSPARSAARGRGEGADRTAAGLTDRRTDGQMRKHRRRCCTDGGGD